MSKPFTNWHELKWSDPTVYHALKSGCSLEEIIILLANEKLRLLDQVFKLESIAPRRITKDGKTYVWHCPVELIPEIK